METGSGPRISYGSDVFTEAERRLLNQFSRAAWGHPELFLKSATFPETGVTEFIDLGEHFPGLALFFSGILRHSIILVRDEYRVALDALQGARYQYGAFVVGQPGIGKTLFLAYLIVYLLGQKHAVALQFSYSQPCYAFFTEEGVSLHSIDEGGPLLDHPSFVWVLCDSNHQTVVPHSTFLIRPHRMRVIQTTSPKPSSWKEWSKQVGAQRFVMDVWSEEEVKKLAVILQLNVERMAELARKWGGVPRTLLQYYPDPDDVAERAYRVQAPAAVRGCEMTLERGSLCDLPDDAPSSFYFIRPQRAVRHSEPYVVVPTRTLCCVLAEALRWQDEVKRSQFFKALSRSAETRRVTGFIYECWIHSLLSTENMKIKCEWAAIGSRGCTTQNLSSTADVVSSAQAASPSWTPPFYWIPSENDFPGIDSALVFDRGIYALRVAIPKKRRRSSPADGMAALKRLLPENLKNLPWNLVFVGTDRDVLENLAKKHAGNIFFPIMETYARVGWSIVDPIREQVVFKRFLVEQSGEPMDTKH